MDDLIFVPLAGVEFHVSLCTVLGLSDVFFQPFGLAFELFLDLPHKVTADEGNLERVLHPVLQTPHVV